MASISNDSMMKLYEYLKEHKKFSFNKIKIFNGIKINQIEIRNGEYQYKGVYIDITGCTGKCIYWGKFDGDGSFEDFKKCIDTLNKLKFDKLTSNFKLIIEPNFDDILENKTVKYKECCVCFENTTRTTRCDHHLCYECIIELKKESCPICRKCICDAHDEEGHNESDCESDDE